MDPMTMISYAPPEWVPLLICAGILLKAFKLWLDRNKYDDPNDDTIKESEVVG